MHLPGRTCNIHRVCPLPAQCRDTTMGKCRATQRPSNQTTGTTRTIRRVRRGRDSSAALARNTHGRYHLGAQTQGTAPNRSHRVPWYLIQPHVMAIVAMEYQPSRPLPNATGPLIITPCPCVVLHMLCSACSPALPPRSASRRTRAWPRGGGSEPSRGPRPDVRGPARH